MIEEGGGEGGGQGGEEGSIVKHIKVTGSKLRDHATGQSGSPVGSALTWLLILGLLFCASKLGGSRKSANGGVIGEVAWYAGRASIKLKRMVGGDEVRAPACCLASSGARTEMCACIARRLPPAAPRCARVVVTDHSLPVGCRTRVPAAQILRARWRGLQRCAQ